MEKYILIAIHALSKLAADLEESIPRTDPSHINILNAKKFRLKEVDEALEYFQNLYIFGDEKANLPTQQLTAQEIEGTCKGCMHIDCERDERPCSECCRLDREDRYEEEDPTLADVFPELHGEKDADHES